MSEKPKPPQGLLPQVGAKFWADVVAKYDLRVDELAVLGKACKAMDRVAAMESALVDEPLIAKGSMGQPVVHPLVAEIRAHEAQVASLLARLKLPDDPSAAGESRSTQARAAAQSRWAAAHGAGA